jgi:hypothetical protein
MILPKLGHLGAIEKTKNIRMVADRILVIYVIAAGSH